MVSYLLFIIKRNEQENSSDASQERLRRRLEAGLGDRDLVRLGAAGGKDPDG